MAIFDLHSPKKEKFIENMPQIFIRAVLFTGLALLGARTYTGTIAGQKDMDFFSLIVSTSVYLLMANNLEMLGHLHVQWWPNSWPM